MIQLFEAVRILARAGVDFVVVGGVALRTHGSGYLTQDLDICYSRAKENPEDDCRRASPSGPSPSRPYWEFTFRMGLDDTTKRHQLHFQNGAL